ncbi:hypothetical protein CDAR_226691 [Caerostris darwini]|uniref:Uncharacterized protein n=1 Tax=Caerostris darwini TaxID=1538125 RepID=A0AAV4TVD3_9ARAC|nr:hypothetical protein CDAR_226691 [Caerostris darwini]
MDLLRCEMCNSTITNFANHRCFCNEYSYQGTGFENPDYIFGNNPQEIPATISHSAEGADFNSWAFMNRTSTRQSSIFPQSINPENNWDVNSSAGTNVRYASSNTVQNENFDYFNSSQGILFPATQYFENSDCPSGVKNPAMAYFTAANTSELNPVQQQSINNIELMQHDLNLSFYNQLPPNTQSLEGPSNYLTIYDPTNVPMKMQSRQSAMQNCEISRFQEKEYDGMTIARKSDGREENTSFESYLNSTNINAKYHRNPHTENEYNRTPALKHVSTRTNTITRQNEFLNIHNSGYRNVENRDSYSIPVFGQGLLDSRQGMNEIPRHSKKSGGQFDNNLKFQNVFQCHFCGSYQRNLKGRELPLNSSSVPFKCSECIETTQLKEKIQPCPKFAEVTDGRSANKLQKKMKKSSHMAALQRVSTNTNTIMTEKEFLNIRNSAYHNIDNIDSYSIPHFGKGFLDSQPGMDDIPHYSNKSQTQFDGKIKFQNNFNANFA